MRTFDVLVQELSKFFVIGIWNQLPEYLKDIKKLDKFKTRVSLELKQDKLNFPE